MTTSGDSRPAMSVILPVFDGAPFIQRAIGSLLAGDFADWELIIVDDGSRDGTRRRASAFLGDSRLRYLRSDENEGLGRALNRGLDAARGPLIAYLPADDLHHAGHLASLVALLAGRPEAVLAFSGVRHHYNRTAAGAIEGEPLQLVQVVHRLGTERWVERHELVTDDLERMFWSKLRRRGEFVGTGQVTCEWTDHPGQGHKTIREPLGGITPYRARYRVRQPLRFHSTVGSRIDEPDLYRRFRDRPPARPDAGGLRILLVGELAYNPERILALEERGHRLHGLWMPDPHWYNTVGPLPFGNIEDVRRTDWPEVVRRLRPDIIYALLNWQAVPFAHEVLRRNPGIPFVWHFKEGPFICLEKGTWGKLADLEARADGCIHSSVEMRQWFRTAVPGSAGRPSLILDGDLPKREWHDGPLSPRLSDADGEVHTVVAGRPIGLHPPDVAALAAQGIHLHFHGDFTHGQWTGWIETTRSLAGRFFHLHPQVHQDRWVEEFSRYDAGWLHFVRSGNGGDIRRADWDDLNIPARLATYAAAGLPVILRDNAGAVVAVERIVREAGIGIIVGAIGELGGRLRDRPALDRLRETVLRRRPEFTFDAHADRLIAFFRQVIESARRRADSRTVQGAPACL